MIEFTPITKTKASGIQLQSQVPYLLKIEEQLKESIVKPITFPDPILTLNEQGIIYLNTINVIQGKAGSHKSRLTELLCSCLLADVCGDRYLGFRSWEPDNGFKLIYTDTERNLNDQFPYALQGIINNASLSNLHPPNDFHYISLINIYRSERFEVLQKYLEYMRENTDKHLFIVLDVVTDCIDNFNDATGTMRFIDFLNRMINNHDVTFLCVIHENPGSSDKARGHLGTEIMNKASMQLQIGYEKDRHQNDTDLLRVKFLKTRMIKRPEPIYLTYSQQEKRLVVADDEMIRSVSEAKQHKASVRSIEQSLIKLLDKPMERQEVLEELSIEHNCSQNTIISRINTLFADKGIINDTSGKSYLLQKQKEGRNLIYSLVSV